MAVITERITGDFEERLKEFAAHMIANVARVGAQAMAQVVYDSAREYVPVSGIPTHYFYGSASKGAKRGEKKQHAYEYHSGDLKKSIYQVYSKDRSFDGRTAYHVGWNFQGRGRAEQKVPYGFMVEFGTSKAAARPFLYPAYEHNKARLLAVASEAMRAEIEAGVR